MQRDFHTFLVFKELTRIWLLVFMNLKMMNMSSKRHPKLLSLIFTLSCLSKISVIRMLVYYFSLKTSRETYHRIRHGILNCLKSMLLPDQSNITTLIVYARPKTMFSHKRKREAEVDKTVVWLFYWKNKQRNKNKQKPRTWLTFCLPTKLLTNFEVPAAKSFRHLCRQLQSDNGCLHQQTNLLTVFGPRGFNWQLVRLTSAVGTFFKAS